VNNVGQEIKTSIVDTATVDNPIQHIWSANVGNPNDVLCIDSVSGEDMLLKWAPPTVTNQNQVYVSVAPNEGEFNSIQSAIDSITTATIGNPWLVVVQAGHYNEENISMKSDVYVQGMGTDVCRVVGTTIGSNVFVMANRTSVSYLSIQSTLGNAISLNIVDNMDAVSLVSVKIISAATGIIWTSSNDVRLQMYRVQLLDITQVGIDVTGSGSVELRSDSLVINSVNTNDLNGCIRVDCVNALLEFNDTILQGDSNANGVGIYALNGRCDFNSISIRSFKRAVWSPISGGTCNLVFIGSNIETSPTSLEIANLQCSGYYAGYAETPTVFIDNNAPFFLVDSDAQIITVAKKGGNFTTIVGAINYISSITPPSAGNVYVIKVGAGNFVETQIILPEYCEIIGQSRESSSIIPHPSLTGDFVVVNGSTRISNATIYAPSDGSAIFYGGTLSLNLGTVEIIDVSFFGSNEDTAMFCRVVPSSGTHICNINFVGVRFVGIFRRGLLCENNFGSGNSCLIYVTIHNLEFVNIFPRTIGSSIFETNCVQSDSGVNTCVLTLDSVLIYDFVPMGTITAINVVAGTLNLSIGSCRFGELQYVLKSVSTTALQNFQILYSEIINQIPLFHGYIEIPKFDATGNLNIVGNMTDILIPDNSLINVVCQNQNNGDVVMSGNLFQGPTFNGATNITPMIQQSTTLGRNNGGNYSSQLPLQVTVSTGNGYVKKNNNLKYVTWPDLTINVPVNSTKYVYLSELNGIVIIHAENNPPTDLTSIMMVARVRTDSTDIIYFQGLGEIYKNGVNQISRSSAAVFGSLFASGGIVSKSAMVNIDISSGVYYYGNCEYVLNGGSTVAFRTVYNSAIFSPSTTSVPLFYENMGVLFPVGVGEFARHTLFAIGNGVFGSPNDVYILIYAESTSLTEATTVAPLVPSFFGQNMVPIADIIVNNIEIISVLDVRPVPSVAKASGISGITVHNDLSGRDALDAHDQYLLKTGGTMSGNLDMSTNSISDVLTVNGIVIQNISTRLTPNGQDPLPTSTPVSVTDNVNDEGMSDSFARSDHRHSHGDLAGGSLHLDATTVLSGFMSAVDKVKLDGSSDIPSDNALVEWGTGQTLECKEITLDDVVLKTGNNQTITLKALANIMNNYVLTLPATPGSPEEFLKTDGTGETSWGVPSSNQSVIQLRTTSPINLNTGGTIVQWTIADFVDGGTFSNPNTTTVQILQSGRYRLYVSMVVQSGVTRAVIDMRFYVNGVAVPGQGCAGYIRGNNSQLNDTSQGCFEIIQNLNINDQITVVTSRSGASGTVNVVSGQSIFIIQTI
jgi:pectin methylesterase-like acyl-CoA thioesterase